jgi:hypothetical protein
MGKRIPDTRNHSTSKTAEQANHIRPELVPLDLVLLQRGADLRLSLERIYRRIFNDPDSLPDLLADTCVQHVGRLSLDYAQIVRHVLHVRKLVRSINYSVPHAIARDDTIADRHIVELTLRDARSVKLEVLCLIRIAQGKIVELYESSQVLEGDEALSVLATAME